MVEVFFIELKDYQMVKLVVGSKKKRILAKKATDGAHVYEDAKVYDKACVAWCAEVYGDVEICGTAKIGDGTYNSGVYNTADE